MEELLDLLPPLWQVIVKVNGYSSPEKQLVIILYHDVWVGLSPLPVTVAHEGLVRDPRDPLLNMFHNPGGDWHPGRGVDQMYHDVCA